MKCINTKCREHITNRSDCEGQEGCEDLIPEAEKPSPPSVDSPSAGWATGQSESTKEKVSLGTYRAGCLLCAVFGGMFGWALNNLLK